MHIIKIQSPSEMFVILLVTCRLARYGIYSAANLLVSRKWVASNESIAFGIYSFCCQSWKSQKSSYASPMCFWNTGVRDVWCHLQICLHIAFNAQYLVFSLISTMIGMINFQTRTVILLPVEFWRILNAAYILSIFFLYFFNLTLFSLTCGCSWFEILCFIF